MPIDDEGQMTLAYAPSRYAELNTSSTGRWTSLPDLGVLWTDDQDGLGTILSGEGDAASVIELISDYKDMGASATAAFDALVKVYNGGSVESGQLSDVASAAEPLTAAALETLPEADEVFAAFRDDQLVDVGKASPNGMYLRDGGEWQLLPDSDLRFDDTEWLPLDDAGVAKYDEAEKSGAPFTRADLEDQAPNP